MGCSLGAFSLVPRLSWGREKEPDNDCMRMHQNLRILSVDYLIVYYQSKSPKHSKNILLSATDGV